MRSLEGIESSSEDDNADRGLRKYEIVEIMTIIDISL